MCKKILVSGIYKGHRRIFAIKSIKKLFLSSCKISLSLDMKVRFFVDFRAFYFGAVCVIVRIA